MSNQRIEKLTPEQEALIPVYLEKWQKIALSTEAIDRQKASDAIKSAYNLINISEPKIIFFDSPYAAAKHIGFEGLYSELNYDDLLPQVREKLLKILLDYFSNLDFVIDEHLFKIISNIELILESEIADKLDDGGLLPYEFEAGHMQTDIVCYECGWLDFGFSELNYEKPIEWDIYQNILQNCGRIYAYQEACLICLRPIKLSFDSQGHLHGEGEPALEYADGFKIYAYNGSRLSDK